MKKTKKFIVIAIVAMFIVSTFAVIVSASSSSTIPEYHYTLNNGWHNVYTISGSTVNGSLYCEYNNGVFSAPSVTSIVNGAGDLNYVGLDLYMWVADGGRFEKYDTADSTLELTVKAGFWDSATSTWHYGKVYGNNKELAYAQVFGKK